MLRFRVLGASFSRFGCFVLRSLFSSASFSKLPIEVYNSRPVSLTIEVLLIKIVLFSTPEVINPVFHSNQGIQKIEFVDRPVPEKLDIYRSFLVYGHEVPQEECAKVKYKATRHRRK